MPPARSPRLAVLARTCRRFTSASLRRPAIAKSFVSRRSVVSFQLHHLRAIPQWRCGIQPGFTSTGTTASARKSAAVAIQMPGSDKWGRCAQKRHVREITANVFDLSALTTSAGDHPPCRRPASSCGREHLHRPFPLCGFIAHRRSPLRVQEEAVVGFHDDRPLRSMPRSFMQCHVISLSVPGIRPSGRFRWLPVGCRFCRKRSTSSSRRFSGNLFGHCRTS